jgi:hypothetical protein
MSGFKNVSFKAVSKTALGSAGFMNKNTGIVLLCIVGD